MREIKFRAWDSSRKEMIATGFHVIGEVTMFSVIEIYIIESEKISEHPKSILERLSDIAISQFTGLSDSEGKEIYEGDIVEIEESNINYVIFERGSFKLKNSLWTIGVLLNSNKIKVIGNIYENPNLIP